MLRLCILHACTVLLHGATVAPNIAECVTIDPDQSSSWKNSATNEDQFSLRVLVHKKADNLRVTLVWERDVEIDSLFEAEALEGAEGGKSITVKPSLLANGFSLSGRGTLNKHPELTCSFVSIASVAGSAAADCELGPHYSILNQWQEGANAEVRFDRWQYHREISLTYDESVEALNPLHASIVSQTEDGGQTIITFRLELQEGAQPCSTGHLDAYLAPERDTNCKEANPENSPNAFSCQLMPPPEGTPRVSCRSVRGPPTQQQFPPPPSMHEVDDHSHPVHGHHGDRTKHIASPPPSSNLILPLISTHSASPPSAAHPTIPCDAACALGGVATVLYALHGNDDFDTMRIIVRSSEMPSDYVFIVGFVGNQMNVSHVAGALHIADVPSAISDIAREFIFAPTVGSTSFGFNIKGVQVQLTLFTCRPVTHEQEKPPPPPNTDVTEVTFSYQQNDYAYDDIDTQHAVNQAGSSTPNRTSTTSTSGLTILGAALLLLGGFGGLIWLLQMRGHGLQRSKFVYDPSETQDIS